TVDRKFWTQAYKTQWRATAVERDRIPGGLADSATTRAKPLVETEAIAHFKFANPESSWRDLSLKGVRNVVDLKNALKRVASPKLHPYGAIELVLKATANVDDASQALKLDPLKDLASVLKDFGIKTQDEGAGSVQKAFAENIRLFVRTPTRNTCFL